MVDSDLTIGVIIVRTKASFLPAVSCDGKRTIDSANSAT